MGQKLLSEEYMPANAKLKALRDSRNISLRKVEFESHRIAEAKGDRRFYISNTRLTQLENDPLSEPSVCKLFSLSAIYRVSMIELLRFYDVDSDESDKYSAVATPGETRLLSSVPDTYRTVESLRDLVKFPDKTTLLPREVRSRDVANLDPETKNISFGYIGLADFTMYPMIRPGSFVWIDARQNNVRMIPCRNEHERPIYFVELRDGYSCTWCELQGNQLLLIPHPSSPVSVQHFRYRKEAEIVGRVVKFHTSC
jgi:transcriptional regulator with XRE-family HTH domain